MKINRSPYETSQVESRQQKHGHREVICAAGKCLKKEKYTREILLTHRENVGGKRTRIANRSPTALRQASPLARLRLCLVCLNFLLEHWWEDRGKTDFFWFLGQRVRLGAGADVVFYEMLVHDRAWLPAEASIHENHPTTTINHWWPVLEWLSMPYGEHMRHTTWPHLSIYLIFFYLLRKFVNNEKLLKHFCTICKYIRFNVTSLCSLGILIIFG